MFSQVVQFHAVPVVDIYVLFLRHGKVLVVVQPFGVAYRLVELQFASELALAPVHGRDVTLASSQKQFAPVAAVVANVRSQVIELQIEALLCRRHAHFCHDGLLREFPRLFQLVLCFEKSARVLQQDLGVFCLDRRILVLFFELLQVAP